jgi:hypothetical protein
LRAVRTSERRCFKRCRKRWEYEYLEGLVPIARSPKLWVGTAVHLGVEAFYSKSNYFDMLQEHFKREKSALDYNKMDESQRRELDEDIELVHGMTDHYVDWANENDKFDVVETEIYAEIPLSGNEVMTLRADALGVDDKGRHWLIEHKTTTNIDADSVWLEIDDQASSYTWGWNKNLSQGVGKVRRDGKMVPAGKIGLAPIEGIIYNFLLKQVPREPALNKDGSVSRGSQNLKCTAEDYEKALLDGPDYEPGVFEDFLSKLRAKKWFHRLLVYRGDDELEGFYPLLQAEIAEMNRAEAMPEIRYRNPHRDCNWDCAFFDICKGELEGLDMSTTREEKFIVERQLELPEVK